MKVPLYDVKAPKQTVSLTLNSDLYGQAKKLGINASQVAEEALDHAVAKRLADLVRAEIRQDLAAYNSYVAEHGSPAEMARAHYAGKDDAV
ncbi:MAG: type II toxin-antitoxin system CcdA family antitoxin [Gammaproteobacteria bacterium]|nr:type II toxin-antitoxin system CcdA family antitoxin [Gammaproteobacteria bacterium]MDE2348003.1 type II toxin-antitoxin system CcdA family antitoxin [Gammaproteobacteria bacterium]